MDLVELAFFSEDVEAMASFYRRLLGSEPIAQSETMAVFLVGTVKILIHAKYVANPGELPPDNHVAFGVEDVDETCHRLQERGMALEIPPNDYHWGRSAYLRDPGGLQIEITELLA